VLLAGAFVVGWSAARAVAQTAPAPALTPDRPEPVVRPQQCEEAATTRARPTRSKRLRLKLGVAAALAAAFVTGGAFSAGPDAARAPLTDPIVAAREHAQAAKLAAAARITLLRRLQLAGVGARRVGLPEAPARPAVPAVPFVSPPNARASALATYVQALGVETILSGLDASRARLERQVLDDPRVHIYPAGRGDIESGKVDIRVLAIIEYLAQADGDVGVSCLISGHSLYVAGRPGVVSAHIYGRAVDISSVGGVPILGHQGPGSVTERTIEQILALPPSIEPLQVISLMSLGGPSFALPDHSNHIHVGY
jgi:hypothetical protein